MASWPGLLFAIPKCRPVFIEFDEYARENEFLGQVNCTTRPQNHERPELLQHCFPDHFNLSENSSDAKFLVHARTRLISYLSIELGRTDINYYPTDLSGSFHPSSANFLMADEYESLLHLVLWRAQICASCSYSSGGKNIFSILKPYFPWSQSKKTRKKDSYHKNDKNESQYTQQLLVFPS